MQYKEFKDGIKLSRLGMGNALGERAGTCSGSLERNERAVSDEGQCVGVLR